MTDEGAPVVETATISAGHDGRAELVVSLRHANGATTTISLDEEALGAVFAARAVSSLDDLPGRSWAELTSSQSTPIS